MHQNANRSGIVMLDAMKLGTAIRTRRVSCVEVMSAYLDHIDRLNPKVNAIVGLRERAALLTEAAERDRQLARGDAPGPLHGFPLAVKDLMPVAGVRMTMGSPILADFVPPEDGIMVERLRAAGGILIGKTNTPEFGLGSNTYNPVYGPTHNAYGLSRSAGGSSGGAAAALALRMLPVADGSDYGGSLRNPAGWNNVFGFRTTGGLVPVTGCDVWLPSMGVIGPMARSVTDLALLLSVQAGFDSRQPLSLPGNGHAFSRWSQGALDALGEEGIGWCRGKRIAWCGDFGGAIPFEPEVLAVCRDALRVLEALGCRIEESAPEYPIDAVWDAWLKLRAWQVGGSLLAYYRDPAKRKLLKPEAMYEVERGLELSAFDVSAASAVRTEWYEAVRRSFEKFDFLVAPTAQLFPFDVSLPWPAEVAGTPMTTYHEWMKCVVPVTMCGCPALAAPAGFGKAGLPIGIQIVAPLHRELDCLRLAHAYDTATRWPDKCPPPLLELAQPGGD
ncbi:MAG TPA: amidase [Steroidobacteraceae bacterium]|jgi:amidase|nr:amidase [Steroidobacteraceae bacterium]